MNAATSAQEDPSGEFSLTYPPLLETDVVAPALLQLSVEFPKLTFRTVSTEQPLDLLRDNLDVAIHAGALPDSVYRALPLGVMKDHFYVANGFFRGEPEPTSPEELANRNWIVPTWQTMPIQYFAAGTEFDRGALAPLGTLNIKPFATCTTMASLMDLSKQGLGIALMPELRGLPLVQSGDLVRIVTGYEGRAWPFYYVHPFKGEKPIHVTRFYELLRRFFAKALIA